MTETKTDFESTNCYICQSPSYELYSSKGQFGLTTNVVICKDCGFSYLNPRWNKKRYDHFYTFEYDNYYRPEVKSSYNYDQYKSIKDILTRLKNASLLPENPTRIIDIGAGMGDSIIYLKNNIFKNAECFAIEPSEFCAEHLKKNGINLLSNDVDSNWDIDNENKFDFVIMRHVLEHFLNPIDVLKKVSKILKPNGIVYIGVPNSKKPTKPLINHYFRVVHVSYFSTISLNNALSLSKLNSLLMKEGDDFEQFEIYTVCQKKDETVKPVYSKDEFFSQKKIYDNLKRIEFYYTLKRFAWKIISIFK